MRNNRLLPFGALLAAGLLWGTTVPLTKLALAWLGPGWLTVARFTVATLLLAVVAGTRLRTAVSPAVLVSGAVGYGGVIVLQNAGIARTSVSHAALLVGATPVLVALLTVGLGRGRVRPLSWIGFAAALAGVGLVARDGGDGATVLGDALVSASLLASAGFVVAQPRLLRGRDPVAVTAVQLAAGAVAALPVAVGFEGLPAMPGGYNALGAVAALAVAGTLVPFTLFAYGQARVAPEVAGAFLNLEPLVGAAAGVVAFGDPFGAAQIIGGSAILAGIAVTTAPRRLVRDCRRLEGGADQLPVFADRMQRLADRYAILAAVLSALTGLAVWRQRPSAPAVSPLHHITGVHVPPGNDGEDDHDQQAGVGRLPGFGVHPAGGPDRQRDGAQPDQFPRGLEQQQRQHPQRVPQSQVRQRRQGRQHATDDTVHQRPRVVVVDHVRPHRHGEADGEKEISAPEGVEARQRQGRRRGSHIGRGHGGQRRQRAGRGHPCDP